MTSSLSTVPLCLITLITSFGVDAVVLWSDEGPIIPESGKIIGVVDIEDSMHFAMDITIHSFLNVGDTAWGSVFQCGNSDGDRMPGIFLNVNAGVAGHNHEGIFVQVNGGSDGGSLGNVLDLEQTYHLEVEYNQEWWAVWVDWEIITAGSKTAHSTGSLPCYSSANFAHGNPNITIENLVVKSVSSPTSNPTASSPRVVEVKETNHSSNFGFVVLGGVLVLCAEAACLWFYRRQNQPNSIGLRARNPLVVALSIGEYDSSTLPALPGDKDIESLEQFADFMGYTFTSNHGKVHWKKEEILQFMRHTVVGELVSVNGDLRYDSLIVCVSGHGMDGGIITSDCHLVDNDVFHRIISGPNPTLRNIPRLFIFDACDGTAECKVDDDDEGKHGGVGMSLRANRMDLSALPRASDWTTSGKNPDYNLVQIRAANKGFMAKANEEMGSYLTRLIIENMMESIERGEDKTIAEVLKDCQQTLHRFGKQLPDFNYNNDTDGLRFEKRSRGKDTPF